MTTQPSVFEYCSWIVAGRKMNMETFVYGRDVSALTVL